MGSPSAKESLLLSVVVPVYNERPTIVEQLRRVALTPFEKEIVVVDDGSDDGTREYLSAVASGEERIMDGDGRQVSVKVILETRNRGKGAALRRAFVEVEGDIVLVQDADLEYDPRDYEALISPIREGVADVVYGSRFLGGTQRAHLFWHSVGNRLLTLFSNVLNNLDLTDMETGSKVFRREVIADIGPTLRSSRFGIEPEITAKVARRGYRIYETPIAYHGRDYSGGKKITWRDGLAAVYHVVRFRLAD